MLPIALDAMGGDKAPGEIVAGAVAASAELGVEVLLVGRPEVLAGLDTGGLEVLAASEVIEMAEDPAKGVRTKKDSSLVRAAEAVRDGRASAMVSAGNTGATMASALLRMGRIKGVIRPAIATPIPIPGKRPTILLDAGANAECTPEMLGQFARMGSAFCTARYGTERPTVGLLSIGEEPGKGDPLRKETFKLLSEDGTIRFEGNVEGRDVLSDTVDVIVTDGFTGNVTLKTLEGALRTISAAVFGVVAAADKAVADAIIPGLLAVAEELDPDTTGGAMLLGVEGVCIISHGSSSARAVVNACRQARDLVEHGLVDSLRASLSS
jgi:glycerol-3-phosphate acyltransferase PlsX